MADKTEIVQHQSPTERVETDDTPKVGEWYWVTSPSNSYYDESEYDEPGKRWLACVVEVGSNYAKVEGVRFGDRIKLEYFHFMCTREYNPDAYIQRKVSHHQDNVRDLLGQIQQITASLGITPRDAIASESEQASTALAVAHGTNNIKDYKNALIKAKKETLPDLFKQVEKQHEQMANWMKAQLIPAQAELAIMKESTEKIEDKIFTVELYAGLLEELHQIRGGSPAHNDEKIKLFQRRHYMDEECLLDYKAGGMDFKSLRAFDKWIANDENFNRIFPHKRCVVAFRVRRDDKERAAASLADFIKIIDEMKLDKLTFLYIRNGNQLFRLHTEIDFGSDLFPDKERNELLSGEKLFVKKQSREVISQRDYDDKIDREKEARQKYAEALKQWRREGKNPKDKPSKFFFGIEDHFDGPQCYEELTPNSLYYDDAMRTIARTAMEHNRVAVVLQGLLDRSPAFQPHPPWRLWTPEGFMAGIELVYDDSRALVPGPKPDFEVYRNRLNSTLKAGDYTVGQYQPWLASEIEKERVKNGWRHKGDYWEMFYKPYGNPGPSEVAKVVKVGRDGSCHYEWERERQGVKWVEDPDDSRYMKIDDSGIKCHFKCSPSHVLNVSAYKAGDFKQFYNDPRTRAEYLKWAPLLLTAEDFVHGKWKADDE